jgi:trimethylguanosine synthase
MLVVLTSKVLYISKNVFKKSREYQQKPQFITEYGDMKGTNKEIGKYFDRCFYLFSKFDLGIKLDVESWFSVTPEIFAVHIAKRLKGRNVIDGFCGAGGNLIQFALENDTAQVYGNDIDPVKVEMARHNAKIYGVQDKIELLNSDFLQLNGGAGEDRKIAVDTFFISPPWGGTTYLQEKKFKLLRSVTPDITDIIAKSLQSAENLVLLLPRTTPVIDIVRAFGVGITKILRDQPTRKFESCTLEIEGLYVNSPGDLSMLCVYFGEVAHVCRKAEANYIASLVLAESFDTVAPQYPKITEGNRDKFTKVKEVINQIGVTKALSTLVQARKKTMGVKEDASKVYDNFVKLSAEIADKPEDLDEPEESPS